MIKANFLPKKHSFFYKIINLTKGKKNNFIDTVENKKNESLKVFEIEIENKSIDPIIHRLFMDLRPFEEYVSVYLHGSWADETQTIFSDIDDFIILDTEGLKEKKYLSKVCNILNSIDMEFSRIDPIQHHGHWICSTNELENYDNSFIPLYILKEAKIVMGRNTIVGQINHERTKVGLRKNIINTCKAIEILSRKLFNNSINAYELKGLVGSFALMPAFIMQLKGDECSKPEAIKTAYKIFSESSLLCIQWSTNNRKNWHELTNKFKFMLFSRLAYLFFDPFLWRIFSNKFSPRVHESTVRQLSDTILTKQMVDKFISESLDYAK